MSSENDRKKFDEDYIYADGPLNATLIFQGVEGAVENCSTCHRPIEDRSCYYHMTDSQTLCINCAEELMDGYADTPK